jgi:hypothetical protein
MQKHNLKSKMKLVQSLIEKQQYLLLNDIQHEQELITFMTNVRTDLKAANSTLRATRKEQMLDRTNSHKQVLAVSKPEKLLLNMTTSKGSPGTFLEVMGETPSMRNMTFLTRGKSGKSSINGSNNNSVVGTRNLRKSRSILVHGKHEHAENSIIRRGKSFIGRKKFGVTEPKSNFRSASRELSTNRLKVKNGARKKFSRRESFD